MGKLTSGLPANSAPVNSCSKMVPADAEGEVMLLASNANMWGMSLAQFFGAMGYYLYITWFPTYLREKYGFDMGTAGLLTVIFSRLLLSPLSTGQLF